MSDGIAPVKKIPVDMWYCGCKVVLKDADGFPRIEPNFICSIAIDSKQGHQFFICQKVLLQNGDCYILEKYDHEKLTVYYRKAPKP